MGGSLIVRGDRVEVSNPLQAVGDDYGFLRGYRGTVTECTGTTYHKSRLVDGRRVQVIRVRMDGPHGAKDCVYLMGSDEVRKLGILELVAEAAS